MKVEKMTTAELEKRLTVVAEELARVKTQLDFAKSDAAATGQYSDSNWFNRARHALRMRGLEHQLILQELAKRRKAERRDMNARVEIRFMQAAKRRIEPELYLELLAEAKAR